jgi:hypothetical protein
MPSDGFLQFEPLAPVPVSPMEEGFLRGGVRVVLLLRLDGVIERDCLAQALRGLQKRHPKLRAILVRDADGRHRYDFDRTAPPITATFIDCDEGEPPWREEARRLLDLGPPPAAPLAEVAVLRSRLRGRTELILSVHHGIADGRSGIMLVDDLLTEYASAQAHQPQPVRPALPVVSLARARFSGGWRNRLRLLRRFVRLQREEVRSPQTRLPKGDNIPPLTQWVRWVFSREDTLALTRRCRREQVSLNAMLISATFCGLMDCLPVTAGFFKCYAPFDVRDALEGASGPIETPVLGSFVGMMRQYFRVPQQPALWELAREIHENVQEYVQLGGPALSYNLMRMATQPRFPQFLDMLPSGSKRPTLFVTNYGVVTMRDAYGTLRPLECTLIFKGDEETAPWLIMEALVMGQRLNFGFAADSVEPAFWERLHVAIRRQLDAAARVDRPKREAAEGAIRPGSRPSG